MNPCGSCDVFVANVDDPATGRCHLHPPDTMAQAPYGQKPEPINAWPHVDAQGDNSGCGDWVKPTGPHAENKPV